ncbi:MAG: methyl-accepting chemotaxis protein [Burkholderiales bacterium]
MALKLSNKINPKTAEGRGLSSGFDISRAFILIGLLFLLPVTLLIYNAVQQSKAELGAISKKREGVKYLGPVRELWRQMTLHRGVFNPLLNNDQATLAKREPMRAKVDGLMASLTRDLGSNQNLGLGRQMNAISKLWGELKANLEKMDEPENFAAHNNLLDQIQSLAVTVADNSTLTLDTSLDSYYLQDTYVNRLPTVLYQTGLARRLSGEVAAKKAVAPEDRALYNTLSRSFTAQTALVANGYRRALDANEKLDADLGTDVSSANASLNEIMATIKTRLMDAPKIEIAPDEIRGQISKSADRIYALGDKTLAQLDGILEQRNTENQQKFYATLGAASVVTLLGLLGLYLLARGAIRNTKAREEQSKIIEIENKKNQAAILQLLNEMGSLADGDLTVRAQVTEDITGAIADSMNYTVDELRVLVQGVNGASHRVSERTHLAQQVSERLLDATDRQSREIEETTAQVLRVTQSINQVSVNAAESAKVAQRSLEASEKGAGAVQNSIKGMAEIREHIQDTSKRIKRLGESSQEIGEIVELISGITEQTNVLALNAAIQAASAGEAGRGFSVVAEEVQRLAERSAEATRQIGAIVKTIQADTHDAVVAMEKSTQGVVEGARLSDAAGQALNEINQVSKQLAGLIQSISKATQDQATATNTVAKNMREILTITKQTTEGTREAADSVLDLAELAGELKGSVSGFKL